MDKKVGAAERRVCTTRSTQEHPDRQHLVSHPDVPVVKDRPSLVAECPEAVLACVSPDVSLISAVPDDINPTTTRAEQAVGLPDRPEQLSCSLHIGKRCQQEQQRTGFFSFLRLAVCHEGVGDIPLQIFFGYACSVRDFTCPQHSADEHGSIAKSVDSGFCDFRTNNIHRTGVGR